MTNDVMEVSDADDEGEDEVEEAGEECERLALEREGAEVKRLIDPQLPSKKEVEEHWVRGHIPYRNWCEVCVRARGREREIMQKIKGVRGESRSTASTIVSRAMKWDTSGQCWWGRRG